MKLLLVFLPILALILKQVHCATASYCRAFECNKISQKKDGPQTCVLISGRHYPVETCKNVTDGEKVYEMECSANDWLLPSDATEDSKCRNITIDPEPADNSVYPGDNCTDSKQCYGDIDKVSCSFKNADDEFGYCQTSVKAGDDCNIAADVPLHGECPVDTYCMAGEEGQPGKCNQTMSEGQSCTGPYQCQFGLLCLATDSTTGFQNMQCTKPFNLDAKTHFSSANIPNPTNTYLGLNMTCKSAATVLIDEETSHYMCINADVSDVTEEDDLARYTGSGNDCNYRTYNLVNDTMVKAVDYSMCGFNQDSAGYCRKRKGDQWFTDAYLKVTRVFNNPKCHVMSSIDMCYNITSNAGNLALMQNFLTAYKDVDLDHGYPLYANNDDCVKYSITSSYWDDKPDSAVLFTKNVVLSSILLIVFIYLV